MIFHSMFAFFSYNIHPRQFLKYKPNLKPQVLFSMCVCSVMSDSLQPQSMECSRQEYWSELPFPTMGDLPDPGNKLEALMSPALAGGFFTTTTTWEAAETTLVLLYHPPPGSSDPGPCTSHSPGS